MTASHKDTETVKLSEWDIENNKSGAKFALDKAGIWKIQVTIDEKPFTILIVQVDTN